MSFRTSILIGSQPLLTESASELEVVVITRSVFLASLASESVALPVPKPVVTRIGVAAISGVSRTRRTRCTPSAATAATSLGAPTRAGAWRGRFTYRAKREKSLVDAMI